MGVASKQEECQAEKGGNLLVGSRILAKGLWGLSVTLLFVDLLTDDHESAFNSGLVHCGTLFALSTTRFPRW